MSPTIVATYRNKKSPLREFLSTDAAITSQAATTISQVKTTEDLRQLDIVQLDALLVASSFRKLKHANFQPLVPNAKTVLIPEQDLHPVPLAVEEQEQVTRQGILVKHRLGQAHQGVEATVHMDRRCTEEDANIGKRKIDHDEGLGRMAPTASTTFTNTASPTPTGNLTVPPLGNLISTGDAVNETGKNFGSFISASVGPCPSSRTESGMPSRSRLSQRQNVDREMASETQNSSMLNPLALRFSKRSCQYK
jgi:hypothetical protein